MIAADTLVGQTKLERSIVMVFVTYWLQISEYILPWFASLVDILWLVSAFVMAYLTGKALKGLQDQTISRLIVRVLRLMWCVSSFAFVSATLLVLFHPLGYTTDDIMITAVQLLSPVVLAAIAIRATHLVDTSINKTKTSQFMTKE